MRYAVIIAASMVIMLCAGAVYAWSIFVAPLKAEFGYSTTQTQIVFGLIIGVFTLSMLFVNKVLRKYGPRISGIIGAVFFSLGYLVASFSQGNLLWLILGMSVLSGIGMAFGYVTVLNNLVKWFPHHKGLATGLAVSGFGGGAILLSQIARPLLAQDWAVLDIFRLVGLIYGVLFLAGSLLLAAPARRQTRPEEAKVEVGGLLKDRRFWILFYVFFAGSFAGMLFSGNLKPIGQSYGVGDSAAVLAISLFSIGNAAGRIFWGQIHDMLGGKKAVLTALSLLAVFTLLLMVGSGSDSGFMLLTLLVGLTFGSNFVTYAADCCQIWGTARLDIIYPAVSIAYGLAGILGPIAGGMIRDSTGTYYWALIASALVCASGIAVYSFLKPQTQVRAATARMKRTAGIGNANSSLEHSK
jgi:MFS transporter, OFA family, oxalate/formate antiporter